MSVALRAGARVLIVGAVAMAAAIGAPTTARAAAPARLGDDVSLPPGLSTGSAKARGTAAASAFAGPGFETFDASSGHVLRDADAFTIRLTTTSQGDVEQLRTVATWAAAQAGATSGVSITVAPGTIPDTPGSDRAADVGEIILSVDSTTPCGTGGAGCGGPRQLRVVDKSDVDEIRAGRIWVAPSVLGYSQDDQRSVVAHELGHALGLSHYDASFEGHVQLMNSTADNYVNHGVYQSGDRNGLNFLHPQGIAALAGNSSPSALLDPADDQAWVHSRNPSSQNLQYANWKSSSGWSTVNLGSAMRLGTTPAPLLDLSTKQQWVYYVSPSGQLKYWNWRADTGWVQNTLPSTVAPNTSPVAVLDQATKQQWVYFVNASGQLTYWNWRMADGWTQYSLASPVAPGSSPTVAFDPTTKEQSVYYVTPTHGLGRWRWTSATAWVASSLAAYVAGGTSPTVLRDAASQQQWVHYVDGSGSLKYWNWRTSDGWTQYSLPADVALGTSPSILYEPATLQQWVYYVDKSGNIGYWNWRTDTAWTHYSLAASVSPGSGLATVNDRQTHEQWVYYRHASGTIAIWNWRIADGWTHY